MNLTQIYLASPDWLKLVFIITPQAALYGLAWLLAGLLKKVPVPCQPAPAPHDLLHLPHSPPSLDLERE